MLKTVLNVGDMSQLKMEKLSASLANINQINCFNEV